MKTVILGSSLLNGIVFVIGAAGCFLGDSAFAQTASDLPLTALDAPQAASVQPPTTGLAASEREGWTPTGVVSGQFNWDRSQNAVGQTSGSGQKYTANLGLGLKFKAGENRWSNQLDAVAGYTRTASLPRLVKSTDDLKFVSMYTYTFETPVGPYVRYSLGSTLFDGRQDTAEENTYLIANSRGQIRSKRTDSLLLSTSFKPVTTRESVGAFLNISKMKEIYSVARLGVAYEQFSRAGDALVINDRKETSEIEVETLRNYAIGGIEGGLSLESALGDATRLTAEGEFLYPLMIEDRIKGDKKELELLNWEVKAKLSTQALTWLSVIYEFKAKKQPFVQQKVQLQQVFGLQAFYTFL